MKREPIYERLAPGEALIMARDEDGYLEVAENEKGKVVWRRVERN